MAFKSILMDQIEKIRDLLSEGYGNKPIARITGLSKNTVKRYRSKIESVPNAGTPLNAVDMYSDYYVSSSKNHEELLLLLPDYIKRLKKVGMTREHLWNEYIAENPQGYSYGEFCRKIKNYKRIGNATLNLSLKAGEVMQADFAGKGIEYIDKSTGDLKKAEILICVLPFSKKLFAIALASQKTEDFIHGITSAFNFFGGSPKLFLSDNLRSYVTKSDRYCPTFIHLARQLSSHYTIELDATRVARPQDKASVERGVNLTYQNIHVHINKLSLGDLDQLNLHIKSYLHVFNNKECKEFEMSRNDYFTLYEKEYLKTLPPSSFDVSKTINAKVQDNYHIYLGEDKHYYSVPFKYIGKDQKNILPTFRHLH